MGEVTVHASLDVSGGAEEIADQINAFVLTLETQTGASGVLGELLDRLHGTAAGLGQRTGCTAGGAA